MKRKTKPSAIDRRIARARGARILRTAAQIAAKSKRQPPVQYSTVTATAARWGCGPNNVRRLIDAGRVPGVVTETMGGVVRHKIPVDAVKPERSTHGRGASYDHDTIRALLADGMSVDDVCEAVGCGLSLVYQIRAGAE